MLDKPSAPQLELDRPQTDGEQIACEKWRARRASIRVGWLGAAVLFGRVSQQGASQWRQRCSRHQRCRPFGRKISRQAQAAKGLVPTIRTWTPSTGTAKP